MNARHLSQIKLGPKSAKAISLAVRSSQFAARSSQLSALGNSWRHLGPQIADPEHPFPSQVPAIFLLVIPLLKVLDFWQWFGIGNSKIDLNELHLEMINE